jgi:hypothetical protein
MQLNLNEPDESIQVGTLPTESYFRRILLICAYKQIRKCELIIKCSVAPPMFLITEAPARNSKYNKITNILALMCKNMQF